MARFVSVPIVPIEGVLDQQAFLFASLKENVELLIGDRGEADRASEAVTKGNITVEPMETQKMRQVSSQGKSWKILDRNVADGDDYVNALVDLQTLANDLYETRDLLNALIIQLRGRL